MNKKKLVLGISALVLIFTVGLTGCAYEVKMVKGVPADQRAKLYLVGGDVRIEQLDGNNLGFAQRRGNVWGTYISGTNTDKARNNEVELSMEVTAGEHTLTISAPLLIGRKKYQGTFNFEGGKKYKIKLMTPSLFESISKPGFNPDELLSDLGNDLKEGLAGNYIIIITESTRSGLPRDPDWSAKETWTKSIN